VHAAAFVQIPGIETLTGKSDLERRSSRKTGIS
jgi:hypothetical protein